MNKPATLSALAFLAVFMAAPMASAGPRPVGAGILVDCQTRALPSQAAVGGMLGIDNFSQAYAARSRLMVEAGRACQQRGIERVRITLAPGADAKRSNRVAKAESNPR